MTILFHSCLRRLCRNGRGPRFSTGMKGSKKMKTQGEIESAVCDALSKFELEYMGRGPKAIQCHLINDCLFVRLHGVLTVAEHQLIKSLPPEKGRDLLKQVRTQLIEAARPLLEQLIADITETKVISLHNDISTSTGQEIMVFTLEESPIVRSVKRK